MDQYLCKTTKVNSVFSGILIELGENWTLILQVVLESVLMTLSMPVLNNDESSLTSRVSSYNKRWEKSMLELSLTPSGKCGYL